MAGFWAWVSNSILQCMVSHFAFHVGKQGWGELQERPKAQMSPARSYSVLSEPYLLKSFSLKKRAFPEG